MLSLGALSAASLLLVAPFAIPIVFGQEYKTSVTIVMILAFCIPFRFLSTSVGSVLTTNNQMSHKVKCMSVVAGINILLNLILIPSYQEAGAAYSTLACEAILLILYYTSVKKRVFYTEQQEIKP